MHSQPPPPHRIATIVCLLLAVSTTARAGDGWHADPKVVQQLSQKRPDVIYDEAKVPAYTLPPVLKSADGTTITTAEQWPKRREEILELFRANQFGRSPGRPQQLTFEIVEENPKALDGTATLRRVAIKSRQDGRQHQFELVLFLPNARPDKVPVFLFIDNRGADKLDVARRTKSGYWPVEEAIARGYGIAGFDNGQLAPDNAEHYREGVIRLFEGDQVTRPATRPAGSPAPTTYAAEPRRAPDAWNALAAWAWGASRAMDYLEQAPGVDAKKVAVVGHSRGGKTALWAGASDDRFALVVSNSSGEGGADISRRMFGETIGIITSKFPYWFCDRYATFADRGNESPVDGHLLLAAIAPRALYVDDHGDDLWCDPRGEFESLAATSPAFALFGDPVIAPDSMPGIDQPIIAGRRGYHIHGGKHDLTLYDWQRFFDFAERLWPGAAKSAAAAGGGR